VSRRLRSAGVALWGIALASNLAFPALAGARDPFPEVRPATHAAAVALVASEGRAPLGCVTPGIHRLTDSRMGASPAVCRALSLLQRHPHSGVGRVERAGDGTPIGFTEEPSDFDRVSPVDVDSDGTPDPVQRVIEGLDRARVLLVDRMQLPAPRNLDVVLLELGPDLEGYLVTRGGGATIVIDGSQGGDAMRRAASHQYAHAVARAAGPRMAPEWAEAFATWTTLELDGGPDAVTAALFSERIDRMDAGLLARDLELAAGNAIWFAFLDEAYGPAAVSVTAEELARGGPTADALSRALGRVSGDDLASAFREFHLWSILVGPRADRLHFSFAERLGPADFASATEGLPALSVQADPALASWGATQIRIAPEATDGGLGIRFEGGFEATWEADLLLVAEDGTLRRLAVELSPEGWGEVTVPLDEVSEALLLVRNVGSEDGGSHRYTYAAHRERGYPWELVSFDARHGVDGVALEWETGSEQSLVGFNLLRSRANGGAEVVVNPVWFPALGSLDEATSYGFVDRGAEPGVTYVYRVQAITGNGLTSLSEPIVARPPVAP